MTGRQFICAIYRLPRHYGYALPCAHDDDVDAAGARAFQHIDIFDISAITLRQLTFHVPLYFLFRIGGISLFLPRALAYSCFPMIHYASHGGERDGLPAYGRAPRRSGFSLCFIMRGRYWLHAPRA